MTTNLSSPTNLEILQQFGLEERVAKLYLALLELGEATVLELARKSGVERTVIYYLLRDLRQLNLIKEIYDSKQHLKIVPASPARLLEIEAQRHQKLKQSLPELKALYHDQPKKPRVRIFEGLEGVDALYDDIIDTLRVLPQDEREMLTYASIDHLLALPIRNQQPFRDARIIHKIRVKVISPDSSIARGFTHKDTDEMRESRVLKDSVPFQATVIIYGDKVAQHSQAGELFALLIENPALADVQRRAFNLAWKGATWEDEQ